MIRHLEDRSRGLNKQLAGELKGEWKMDERNVIII